MVATIATATATATTASRQPGTVPAAATHAPGKRLLVLIAGRAGAGKDTAGLYLANAYGFRLEAYANSLGM